jgi:hypothetical protein
MATEESNHAPTRDGATARERTAAELASTVAEQVRAAIESAEQSAEELRRRARDDAAADRDRVDKAADVVLSRIDGIEAQVARLLDGVRAEVVRISNQAESAHDAPQPVVDPPSEPQRPDVSTPEADPPVSPQRAAPRRHGRRFGRRRRALPPCAVCGRVAEDGEDALEQWLQVRRTSLCPQCQAEGWHVPAGASVPYRSPRGREPG